MLGGAGIGGHSIQVDRLASSAQHGFDYTKPAPTPASSPSPTRTTPPRPCRSTSRRTRPPPTSPRPSTVTTSAPVYAAVVKDGGVDKLVFSSRKTGAELGLHASTRRSSAPAPSLDEDSAYARTGATLNASIKVNGGAEHQPRVQRPRDHHPGRAPVAEGRHGEPGLGQHDPAGRRQRRDHEEDHGARRRLQRRRHLRRARSSPRSVSRPRDNTRTCRRASCSATRHELACSASSRAP